MAILDRIVFEGPSDVLVWKWRSSEGKSDEIRLGAQLIVRESQEALFFKGGQALDLFGPGTHTLATGNLPVLRKLINLPFGGATPFTAEIYFVSKAVSLGHDWGTQTPIVLQDPKYGVAVPLRGYGTYGFRVSNARELLVKLVGTSGGMHSQQATRQLLDSLILSTFQQALGEFLVRQGISALDLPAHTLALANQVSDLLGKQYRTFGVELLNFAIESINWPNDDPNVRQLQDALAQAGTMDIVGRAYTQNKEFYHAQQQYGVMNKLAQNEGGAGGMTAAMMGLGVGFGVAGPSSQLARQAMSPAVTSTTACASCGGSLPAGVRFCSQCAAPASSRTTHCVSCQGDNPTGARFCVHCGQTLGECNCPHCAAIVTPGSKFCATCGGKL